jgi:hypothetical protein
VSPCGDRCFFFGFDVSHEMSATQGDTWASPQGVLDRNSSV